jgi:hypothetical protein
VCPKVLDRRAGGLHTAYPQSQSLTFQILEIPPPPLSSVFFLSFSYFPLFFNFIFVFSLFHFVCLMHDVFRLQFEMTVMSKKNIESFLVGPDNE